MEATQQDGLIAEPLRTADGSWTYRHPQHGASYRSTHGASSESRWVFLQGSGLRQQPGPWTVLELGFGSGLNFELTRQAALEGGHSLDYIALEPEPLRRDLWLTEDGWRDLTWGQPLQRDTVRLTVHRRRWQDWAPAPAEALAVYFDPFGPSQAPDCWSEDCFRWAAQALSPRGRLATFGASSAARRAMRAAGLVVGSLPGAPGKREMTVAAWTAAALGSARPWRSASP